MTSYIALQEGDASHLNVGESQNCISCLQLFLHSFIFLLLDSHLVAYSDYFSRTLEFKVQTVAYAPSQEDHTS